MSILARVAIATYALMAGTPDESPNRYFAIEAIDEQTGRGVPMVELQTTAGARFYTDSNGLVAFFEPGLMGQRVYFGITAHGYEFPKDGFGSKGVALEVKPGESAKLKINRINIAERLYRITGQGIYRDSVLLGRKTPIASPLLNAQVTGQDSVLAAVYQGRTYWFYGDTNRLSYSLGNFATSGATTPLPEKIDPEVGFDLSYFVGKDGFSRPMAPMKGEGVVWLSGLVVVPDGSGRERMLAYYQRRQGLGDVLENGFVQFNDETRQFDKASTIEGEPPIFPTGHAQRVADAGIDYLVFTVPYPALRVKADRASYLDLSGYEAYTCLKPGTRTFDKTRAEVDRDASGKLIWAWKRNTAPLVPKDQQDLIDSGKMTREESPFRLQDAETGKPFVLHGGSCYWNPYRKKYVMVGSELMGATVLGEIWYSEADRPEGPWIKARKIITHANKPGDAHDFYNPKQHEFLDRDGGRYIYFEGTYVNTFSGNPHPTPYYEYNQIMYKLDLGDPKLGVLKEK
ncbi:hypothetical protein [Singulisphaera sp. PoT]|uniref:hypothetical protein n=1 Tax=Singulisphaera sp. PoT TaxID=3411797 RepID=UPI003BF5235C